MSRFEHAFHLATTPGPIAKERLRALHAELVARTPEIAPGAPWRLGLLAAERDYLSGRLLALEYAADPTENIDMAIGWLLLAAYAPDGNPHLATLAGCRLADRLEQRLAEATPAGLRLSQALQAIDDWRSWSGVATAALDSADPLGPAGDLAA